MQFSARKFKVSVWKNSREKGQGGRVAVGYYISAIEWGVGGM